MFEAILISALFAYGMFTIQRPGFLMDWMRPVWKKFPKKMHDTLFECGVCVASLWGGSVYLYQVYLIPELPAVWHPLLYLPIVMIAGSGICAVVDRGVKAMEKVYGYKAPVKSIGEDKWEYLKPYEELRRVFAESFFYNAVYHDRAIVEIGGVDTAWSRASKKYTFFSHANRLSGEAVDAFIRKSGDYDVVILGLAFDGDLRELRKLIMFSHSALIEYSDDGISREQVEKITEYLNVKILIPEFHIGDANAPKQCGRVTKRKIIIVKGDRINIPY